MRLEALKLKHLRNDIENATCNGEMNDDALTTFDQLLEAVEDSAALVRSAKEVVACWEGGNLAFAVNMLRISLEKLK